MERLFNWINERHRIYLERQAGEPWPWTDDPIFQQYRFTSHNRELDRTTVWFRENARDPLRDSPDVLMATLAFRQFNRIETGEVLLQHGLLHAWNAELAEKVLREWRPHGPWTTGAFKINSPNGMDKLAGCCAIVSEFYRTRDYLMRNLGDRLETATRVLAEYRDYGPFMAYEIACDLRHTYLLGNAPDVYSWANVGPGAAAGLKRLGMSPTVTSLRKLLDAAPQFLGPHVPQPLELRDIEHACCELSKYEKARLGQGRPRERFAAPQNRAPAGR
jgi:hypothetical protein